MYFALIFVLLFLAELIYFKIAYRYNIIDKPNERSSHTRITLRGGGVIFYIGILIYFFTNQLEYPWFFIGLTLVTAISFVDDIRAVTQKIRLIFHIAGMGLMFYQWGALGLDWEWWYMIVAVVFCTGIINAYNFMDGINGITGGYSFVVLMTLAYINNFMVSYTDSRLIDVLVLAVCIFIYFNFRRKAKCFAGDVGAVSIAFVIVFLLGHLILKTKDLSYIVLLAVYGVDSVLTVIHRMILRENIGLPHRKHLYQIMANELNVPHVVVSFMYMCVQAVVSIGYIIIAPLGYGYWYLAGTIFVLSLIYICFMKKFFHLHQIGRD